VKPRKKIWSTKRPIAVTVVAWGIVVLFLIRLYQVIEPLIRMKVFAGAIGAPLQSGLALTPLGAALLSSAVYLVLSIVGLAVLIGFLRLERWAWVVLMAWTGVSLAITLLDYFYSAPNYLVMAANVVIALALNQTDVQRIFRIGADLHERTT